MTDQMDNRLRELATKLADSAPDAPPFPRTATKPIGIGRRAPAWVLAAAGAAAVLVIIGVPFLLFSGGTAPEDAATVPTTQLPPAPTTVPGPDTTAPTVPSVVPCTPAGILVRTLEQDGAAGHVVTPLRFINVSGSPCVLDDPLAVSGIGIGGEEVEAALGTYVPIGGSSDPIIDAGNSLVMLLEVGTGCEGGQAIGPEADGVRITLATGDVEVPFSGDLGCLFSYSGFGNWFEAEPLTGEEGTLADDLLKFAANPTAQLFEGVEFAETVTLTLGPEAALTRAGADLVVPASWVFGTEYDGFRGWVGPYSALDLLAQPRSWNVTAGPHDHCASPPMPIHETMEGLRQISIQPTDATSCLEWWAVDLFLTDAGEIAGVTLDLWEP